MESLWELLLATIYPRRCSLCDTLGTPPICAVCLGEFPKHPSPHLTFATDSPLHEAAFGYDYAGRARQAVLRLKMERARALAPPLAHLVATHLTELGFLNDLDAIVPIPIHWRRWCERGFNQSELLCASLSKEHVRPELLVRTRHTVPQMKLNAVERQSNLNGAFRAHPDVRGKRILLVDDVYTSGATARECAHTLVQAGAQQVRVYALTHGGG